VSAGVRRLAAAALLATVGVVLLFSTPAAADDDWVLDRFAADIEIQRDGTLNITESIDVDFLSLQDRHGIFRVIPVRYQWEADPKMLRVYDVDVRSVRDASGRSLTYETSEGGGPNFSIRVGDADRIVTGKQTYRINYTVRGALNPFADHDELFWNVNGGDLLRGAARIDGGLSELILVTAGGVQCDDRPTRWRPADDRDRAAQGRGDRAGADPPAARPRDQ
jgi:hypothetical protein